MYWKLILFLSIFLVVKSPCFGENSLQEEARDEMENFKNLMENIRESIQKMLFGPTFSPENPCPDKTDKREIKKTNSSIKKIRYNICTKDNNYMEEFLKEILAEKSNGINLPTDWNRPGTLSYCVGYALQEKTADHDHKVRSWDYGMHFAHCKKDATKPTGHLDKQRLEKPCFSENLHKHVYKGFSEAMKCLGLDPQIYFKLIFQESHFYPNMGSVNKVYGIAQVTGQTIYDVNQKLKVKDNESFNTKLQKHLKKNDQEYSENCSTIKYLIERPIPVEKELGCKIFVTNNIPPKPKKFPALFRSSDGKIFFYKKDGTKIDLPDSIVDKKLFKNRRIIFLTQKQCNLLHDHDVPQEDLDKAKRYNVSACDRIKLPNNPTQSLIYGGLALMFKQKIVASRLEKILKEIENIKQIDFISNNKKEIIQHLSLMAYYTGPTHLLNHFDAYIKILEQKKVKLDSVDKLFKSFFRFKLNKNTNNAVRNEKHYYNSLQTRDKQCQFSSPSWVQISE